MTDTTTLIMGRCNPVVDSKLLLDEPLRTQEHSCKPVCCMQAYRMAEVPGIPNDTEPEDVHDAWDSKAVATMQRFHMPRLQLASSDSSTRPRGSSADESPRVAAADTVQSFPATLKSRRNIMSEWVSLSLLSQDAI